LAANVGNAQPNALCVRLKLHKSGLLPIILGRLPLWTASGSGVVATRVMGTTIIGGMLAATIIAIFLIPVTYYLVKRFAAKRKQRAPHGEPAGLSSYVTR
jgi:AcrB/AcrD/AcrF family